MKYAKARLDTHRPHRSGSGRGDGDRTFVYTPILPLMTAHAHLTTQSAGQLATANYVGYLVGAVAAAIAPRWPVRWPRAAGHWWSWWQAGGNGIHHQRH
jgi:hypothetical protein